MWQCEQTIHKYQTKRRQGCIVIILIVAVLSQYSNDVAAGRTIVGGEGRISGGSKLVVEWPVG